MTMKMFMSPDNQANELNRFFFELTPSGVLFVIFSLALTVFLYWIFVSIYKNTIAKTKLFQKIFKTGHPSIPNSGYDNVDFYFIGILVSSLPVLCVFFLSFSHISLFQVYSRETEAIDSIKRKDIFEQYDSKVVVTYYNDSYSNHTDNEVRNVILVLEKKISHLSILTLITLNRPRELNIQLGALVNGVLWLLKREILNPFSPLLTINSL